MEVKKIIHKTLICIVDPDEVHERERSEAYLLRFDPILIVRQHVELNVTYHS